MANADSDRIANNRLAVTMVVGSVLVAAVVILLVQADLIDYLIPERGPAADAVPLYVLAAGILLVLVVWSWNRLFSWFGEG